MKTNNTTTTVATTPEEALKAKNEAVKKAYHIILSEIKSMIANYPTEYLRTYLEVDYSQMGFSNQHGFYSPLLHLRFEEFKGECSIYFSKNYNFKQQVGYYLDTVLLRCILNQVFSDKNKINIEDTLNLSLFRSEDYREAKELLDKGFKGCQKVTIPALQKEA